MIFTWKNIITQMILTQLLPIALVFATHTSSLEFTFTRHTNIYQLIMYTFPFFTLNVLSLVDNIEINPKAKALKIVRELLQRLINSFVLVYVLTLFSDNLLLAILGLSETIVFTIYAVWCTLVFTYLLVLWYLVFVGEYALIKSRDCPVERTMLVKVLSGLMGNAFIMSPLIKKVDDESNDFGCAFARNGHNYASCVSHINRMT